MVTKVPAFGRKTKKEGPKHQKVSGTPQSGMSSEKRLHKVVHELPASLRAAPGRSDPKLHTHTLRPEPWGRPGPRGPVVCPVGGTRAGQELWSEGGDGGVKLPAGLASESQHPSPTRLPLFTSQKPQVAT